MVAPTGRNLKANHLRVVQALKSYGFLKIKDGESLFISKTRYNLSTVKWMEQNRIVSLEKMEGFTNVTLSSEFLALSNREEKIDLINPKSKPTKTRSKRLGVKRYIVVDNRGFEATITTSLSESKLNRSYKFVKQIPC